MERTHTRTVATSVHPIRMPEPAPHPSAEVCRLISTSTELDHATADLAAGRFMEALTRVRTVLLHNQNHPRALCMLGQIAVAIGRPAIGLEPLQRAVTLDPRLEHRIWLALCLAKLDCPQDALLVINASVDTIPPTANAYASVAMVFYALGQHDDAARFYARSIALDATRAATHHKYARALYAAGHTEPSIAAYIEAIRRCGTQADYYADLSGALSDLGLFEDARRAAQTAVDLGPACLVAHNNLGHALHSLNRSADALAPYETAIQACPAYAKAQFGYAVALLKCGDFAHGWRQYEWRWQDCQSLRTDIDAPILDDRVWRDEDLAGRTILLHAEQGLGDTLQFVRFAPLVAARGARVLLEVPAPLVRLLRTVEGVADVITQGDPLPPIDFHCPMASLPLAFDLRPDTIPAAPYLRLPAQHHPREDQSVTKPGRPDELVVGLVWAGDPRPFQPGSNLIDRRRSTTLDLFAPLQDIDGIRFVSFQLGAARRQCAGAKLPITDIMVGVTDFADTAARLAGVDLLISVDTSMVHLAGGLGMPVWMLSRFDGCWRWLERRADTPWYPSMRIFRQPSPGDWLSVIAEVGNALRAAVHAHRPSAPSRLPPDVYLQPSTVQASAS